MVISLELLMHATMNKSKIMNNISEPIPKTGMIETKINKTIDYLRYEIRIYTSYLQLKHLLNFVNTKIL